MWFTNDGSNSKAGGERAPEAMSSLSEAAVVHGTTAFFFSHHQDIYSYTISENKWTKVVSCKYSNFSMAILNNNLTTVGGLYERILVPSSPTNILLSLIRGNSFKETLEELFPPMHSKRILPACVTTLTHLLVLE